MYQKDRQEQQELDHYLLPENVSSPSFSSSIDTTHIEKWLAELQIKQDLFHQLQEEMNKKVVGMQEFLNSLFVTVLVGGHALVEWVPGLAKTRTISTLAEAMDLSFKRVQFTPDMLPGDITGIEIYNTKTRKFDITEWPIFANIVLADEINRTTPKVQSALLEAMQEHQVTIWGETMKLPQPFFVLATQNPLEQEWTYPLPEAQVDRFLFHVLVDYPSHADEKKILDIHEHADAEKIKTVLTKRKLATVQKAVAEVSISNKMKDYIIRLVTATREHPLIEYGASPRASIALMQAARAVAFLADRKTVKASDIQSVCLSSLRHRIILSYATRAKGLTADEVLLQVCGEVSE